MTSSMDLPLHQLLEKQAAETPESIALEFYPDKRLTYHELNSISNRLARFLKDHQCRGRDVVALCLEKTHVLVISLLAVLKADMAWLPLPLDAPPARIGQILRACEVEFALYSGSTRDALGDMSPCFEIEEVLKSAELQCYSESNLEEGKRRVNDLCHVLFTSGSTGVPKGVMIEHRAVRHNVLALVKQFNLNHQTRTLQFATPTFDIFSLDLFMTFTSGGCLVMAPLSAIIEDITAFISKTRITYTQLTPTIIQLIDPNCVPNLQVLASSGEALSQTLADQWRSNVRLFNAYGPTETIVCTVQELSGNQLDAAYIGQAIPGLDVCLLAHENSDEVMEGEIGEICVAGPQLFRGYLSTENNVRSTESYRKGRRYYHTGDMGRMETSSTGEKTIRYLGRSDGQVKVHGVRVDLGDIEQSILTCPLLKLCVVVLPRCGSSAGRLCSIIVLNPSLAEQEAISGQSLELSNDCSAPSASKSMQIQVLRPSSNLLSALQEVKTVAKARLATHAIPTTWWAVKELPLTTSGKIDRMKLRIWLEKMDRQSYTRHVEDFSVEAPQPTLTSNDAKMNLLQSLWAEVLDRPIASINTAVSFIELGADSLDVIRLISKARKAGLELSFSQVFTAKTVQRLLHSQQSMEEKPKASIDLSYRPFSLLPRERSLAPILDNVATACGIRVAEIEDLYPCTPYQAGLMALDLKCPMSYVCMFSWTLFQDIEIGRFRTAWDNLIASESVLRNRLIWEPSAQDFWQVTVRHSTLHWREESFEREMSLGHELCRGSVQWDREIQRWKFHLKIHHSIIDGWSLRLMLERLKSMYLSAKIQHSSGTPFAQFIRHRLEECEPDKELASEKFWEHFLEEASVQDFPPLPADPHHEVHATERQSLLVPVDLQEMATSFEVTPAIILYGAAALVLSAHGDSQDVTYGLILAGRDAPLDGIFDMLGPAFVSFPFRTQIDRQLDLRTFFKGVARHILNIIPHQHFGLQRIKQCGNGAAAACEFRCLIVVQPEDENLAGEGLWEKVHGQTSGLADSIPLSLELVLGDNQVLINCNSDSACLSRGEAGVLLSHLSCVLKSLGTLLPQDKVSQVRLAEKDEQTRMLDWARGYGSPVNCCLHELIQDSIQRHRERTAIEDQATQRQITYHELDLFIPRLSCFLRSQYSILPETIIPIAMEKSAVAIITILAVLAAGGAYVPIDLSWPLERVRRILDETHATIILCSPTAVKQFQHLSQKVVEISETCWKNTSTVPSVTDKTILAVPSNLAFVMYTSGSTGVPKGVMLEHRALSTSLTHLTRVFALEPGTRHLQFSSFIYDVSVADIFIPLLSGSCICVPTEYNRLNRLSWTMKDMAIESAILTPSVVDLISPDDTVSLKALMTGGEMTRRSLIRRWAPRVRLLNAYGPTEASITTSVTDTLTAEADTSNIGWNVTGWHWIVRRDHTGEIQPAPMGCIGEIAIAGHCLARGYLKNDTLTQKHFVEAPHLTGDLISPRIYLTGDVGRYETDGTIRVMGRKDRMIKVNGVRVEPGESEHQLRRLGGTFASCVVQCVHDHQNNARLAAFVEATPPVGGYLQDQGLIAIGSCTLAFREMCQSVQRRLQVLLPQQYVPTLFVPITGVPYTGSNKVDLKRLRDELQRIPNASSLFIVRGVLVDERPGKAPVTLAEIALEAAFRQVFMLKHRLTTDVDFFRQGGDSFAAIKLVSAVRNQGFEISVQQIYESSKIERLAAVATLKRKDRAENTQDGPQSTPSLVVPAHLRAEVAQRCHLPMESIEDLYPASPFQEGLFAIAMEEDSELEQQHRSTYHAHMVFRLVEGVDAARLSRALAVVVSQNPIFRTRLVHSSEGAMQVVYRSLSEHESHDHEGESFFSYWIKQDKQRSGMRLIMSIHHTLYDAWTMDRFLDDVDHNYHHPDTTRSGARPYRMFIEHLSSLDSEEASKYWTKQLNDAPLTQFPLLPRTSYRAQATKSAHLQGALNLENTKAAGFSAATVVAAAMALLLSAYCNMDDLCYGMTLSGRDEVGLDDIAGPTLSTVPMRTRIRRDQTVSKLLEEHQSNLLAMCKHQHYGLQNIARLADDGARNASQFRTLLVMQQSFRNLTGEQDDRVVQGLIPEDTSMYVNYALVVIAQVDAFTGQLVLQVEYDPTCLQSLQAERFIQQLKQTMTQCTYPDKLVNELEIITTADRADIAAWNPTLTTASTRYIHHLFEDMVSRQPERPAIESILADGSLPQHLTYRQLDEYATNLCEVIMARASSRVCGLCFHKSPLMVIAMLAIWKSGLAFVTLDPQAPIGRLSAILAEVGSDTVILTESLLAHLFGLSEVIVLDPSLSTLVPEALTGMTSAQISMRKPLLVVVDTAYIMFTSGSSGTPKGVVVSHCAVATSLLDVASTMGLDYETRMLQFAAFTFDTSMLEVWATLITGGCVCIPSEAQRMAGGLSEAVTQLRVSHLILTPTVAQILEPDEISTVRSLMLIGEPPFRHLVEKWATERPTVRIMNGYGPTEASIHSSTNQALSGDDPQNIGQATACNLFITVPDDVLKLAAIGTIGELVVCGNTVADGYLNMPELTAQAFGVNLPWVTPSGGTKLRHYRTGDLARYAPDGSIVYLGRKDLQAKIHGQRLELLEIECQIRRHGSFARCVVDVVSSDLLVAFTMVGSPQSGSFEKLLPPETLPRDKVDNLRTFLRSVLPAFMVPTIYVPVDSWPTNNSGKVDRHLLRKSVQGVVDLYRCRGITSKRRPQTSTQDLLAEVWAETISISKDQISVDDTIASLGGDSVTVIRIIASVRKRGLNLDLTKAYYHRTLGSMAEALGETQPAQPDATLPPQPLSLVGDVELHPFITMVSEKCELPVKSILDVYPCTAMQEALMMSSAKSRGAFFNQEVFRLNQGTSLPKLLASLQAVWARHEILRTRIILDENYRSVQVVVDEQLEVSKLEYQDIDVYLERDASAPPGYGERLTRCAMVTCGPQTYLVISQHHTVFDGWSSSLLLADIQREYMAIPLPSPPSPVFASFIRNVIQVRQSAEAEQFWKQYLTDLTVVSLPQLKSSPNFEANRKHVLEVPVPSTDTHSLATLAEAAWGVLLGRYTDTEDVSFGTVRSGRTAPVHGIDSILGPTIVTIPRRLRPVRTQLIDEYLQQVSASLIEVSPWEQFGHQNIRKLGEDASQACKFDSLIVVQMSNSKTPHSENAILIPTPVQREGFNRADCLTVECQPQEYGQLLISVTFDDRAISADNVSWITYHFSRLLSELVSGRDGCLQNLDMAGPDGFKQVRRWNDTTTMPCMKRVDKLFVERAAVWPTLTAIEASDATLTYEQLDTLSSKLSARLQVLGVSKGDIIPLYMRKCAAMVVAMLAVFKAGAAYVPLATDTPEERLHLLLGKLGSERVLCTSDQESRLSSLAVESICCEIGEISTDFPRRSRSQKDEQRGQSFAQGSRAAVSPDLAYIIFTSGSSGSPKGVMIDHKALATTILENGRQMQYSMRTRTLSFAAYTFDVSVMEIYLTLLHGGCLFIPDDEQRLGDLCGYINDKKIEMAFLTPTAVRNLLRAASNVPSLKTLRVGGEALPQTLVQQWSCYLRLINSYGPTEACVDACRNANVTPTTDANNIGHAIGTHLWVVEPTDHSQLAPIGCSGELLISGPTLALGYVTDEERTRRAFIDGSKFAWILPGEERLYATGDIVRQNSDGSIDFIGRRDLQTKLNGFRIELEEAEYAVECSEGIIAAVVDKVALQEGGSEALVAFFTIDSTELRNPQEQLLTPTEHIESIIKNACVRVAGTLPPYMLPQFYLPIGRIPHTASGKVDRSALQRVFGQCSRQQIASYRSGPVRKRGPKTTIQRILQGLWAQVLSVSPDQIGLDSEFVNLGGESLAAIQLATMCREIGFRLEMADILRKPRLEDMATHVERNRETSLNRSHYIRDSTAKPTSYPSDALAVSANVSRVAEACGVSESELENWYPCVPIQEALMAVTARLPEAYISCERFQLPSSVDLERFRAAWELVHENNPILRTRICTVATNGVAENLQVVCRCRCDWIDTSALDLPHAEMGLGTSLVRYRVLRSPGILLFEILRHHSIYDGFSGKLIWDDFRYSFTHLTRPPPRPSYQRYVNYLGSLNEESTVNFWRDCLEGFQGEHFPILPSLEYVPKATSQTCEEIGANLQWKNSCPFTFATVARAAWAVILSTRARVPGSTKDICFAETLSGRSAPLSGLEDMTGPTISTVPVRVKLHFDQPVDEYLRQIQEQAISMLPFQHFGLGQIRSISGAAQDACKSPSLLVVQSTQLHDDFLPLGLKRKEMNGEGLVETFGLVVECTQSHAQDYATLSASYDPFLMAKQEVRHLLQQLFRMIAEFNMRCTDGSSIRSAIWNLADEADFERIFKWNSTAQASPSACLHGLVEEAAKHHPERLAVDAQDQKLQYGELNDAADVLAATLQAQYHIQAGDLVPIYFEKSSYMIVAILGILKSGAGYVPLDISHPRARVEYIIHEIQARLIVVSPLQARSPSFSVPSLILDSELLPTPTQQAKQTLVSPKDVAM